MKLISSYRICSLHCKLYVHDIDLHVPTVEFVLQVADLNLTLSSIKHSF